MFTNFNRQNIIAGLTMVLLVLAFGCPGPKRTPSQTLPTAGDSELGTTIGMMAEIFASDAIPVRGYALVGGLNGTGSSQCPANIRSYLDKYILQHLSGASVDVEQLISSADTAVVVVEGVIPPAASSNQSFDVRVAALPATQTTSLEGGLLYGADLYEVRQVGISTNSLASAEGPVYIDSLGPDAIDKKTGYVLGGGSVINEYKINLALRRPDYRTASQLRNRINERFGYETAWALSPGSVELLIPAKYENTKRRYVQLVRATYLTETPELTEKRIIAHIRELAGSDNKNKAELALEAIGNASLPKLAALINSSNPEVRLRAARCMLNLGDPKGLDVLREIANDKTSSFRLEAVEAVANSAYQQTASMLRPFLRDDDFPIRLAAYQGLVLLNDATISRQFIAESFYLDQIIQPGKPAIFVSRSEKPCVALFGIAVRCREDMFVETLDGTITINAPAGQKTVTIIRRHPTRPGVIITLKSSLDLTDIIGTLCREPLPDPDQGGPGLGVPYSTLADLLKQLVDAGAIDAEFHAGPLPRTLQARSSQ